MMRVGIVGLGIGQLHLRAWWKVEGANTVIVADSDVERARATGEARNVQWVTSLDEVLAAGVDTIDLCTPPEMHEAQILQCLEAGVHVICEKPLVGSIDACERLRDAARAAAESSGALLMPIMQYRFGAGAAQARALIDAGLTGRLYTASAATWWRRDRAYYDEAAWRSTRAGALGGTLVNHALHIQDLLTWIGGQVVAVNGQIATRVNDVETEDCAVAIARTIDGGLMSMNVTLGAAVESSRLTWNFEHVSIESTTDPYHPARRPWKFDYRDDATAAAAARVMAASMSQVGEQYVGQFQAFVDGIEHGRLPVSLDDAQDAIALAAAWYTSAETGSWVDLQQTR